MSHDQSFKNLIVDYPHAALAFFAAEEAQDLGPDVRILPVRQEQLQERLGERFRELDVPLLVEWPDGRRDALLFVIEEESTARRFSIHRLCHYCVDLSELLQTERVVPVVIFLRAAEGVVTRLRLGGDRHVYLDFGYLRCALAELSFEAYRESDNLVARLNLPNMRYPPARKVEVYAHAVRGLLALEPDPERRLKYLDFIDIYADLDDNERSEYTRDYREESQTMTRFAERFREEGRQQGEACVLERQLRLKFGELPDAVQARLAQADEATLLAWSERVLSATSLEDVLH
jgi:hypothetical protein